MSEYAVKEMKNGLRYFKDKKFISKNDIPLDELEKLHNPELATPVKQCIFCGAHSRMTRFVNLQTVALCDEHFYSETIGKVAQKLREKVNA